MARCQTPKTDEYLEIDYSAFPDDSTRRFEEYRSTGLLAVSPDELDSSVDREMDVVGFFTLTFSGRRLAPFGNHKVGCLGLGREHFAFAIRHETGYEVRVTSPFDSDKAAALQTIFGDDAVAIKNDDGEVMCFMTYAFEALTAIGYVLVKQHGGTCICAKNSLALEEPIKYGLFEDRHLLS